MARGSRAGVNRRFAGTVNAAIPALMQEAAIEIRDLEKTYQGG